MHNLGKLVHIYSLHNVPNHNQANSFHHNSCGFRGPSRHRLGSTWDSNQDNSFHHNSCGFRDSSNTWDIPRNAIVNEVEDRWGCYLSEFFENTHRHAWPYWRVQPATYLCTLAPHYRELSVIYAGRILWVCLRRPVDGDTSQKRAGTLAYVTARLSGKAKEDEPVIVAFGMDVGLYCWEVKVPGGERSLGLRVHYADYSEESSRVNFETNTLAPLKRDWEEEQARKEQARKKRLRTE